MYMNFNDFLEEKHPEYLEEGIGQWVGNKLGQGVDAMGRGIGRVANAVGSGIGAGAMAGARRAGNVLRHGNANNELQGMANVMHAAIASGDRKRVAQALRPIKAYFAQQQQSTNMPNQGQPYPQSQQTHQQVPQMPQAYSHTP